MINLLLIIIIIFILFYFINLNINPIYFKLNYITDEYIDHFISNI